MDPEGGGMNRRMKEALIGGALLGIVCVVGAYIRSGSSTSAVFVFSLWYNRVIIGLVVGAPWKARSRSQVLMRGGHFWGLWFPLLSTALQDFKIT